MIKAVDIFEFLNFKFPISDACDFDNPGFLVGDEQAQVKKVLVALDCDIEAVKEAVKIGANLIITHHPVIFSGLKSLVGEDVVKKVIENRISVISMHTNFDVGVGGVNDILCEKLGFLNTEKFVTSDGFKVNSVVSKISEPKELAMDISKKLGFPVKYVAGRPIKKLLVCSGSGGDFLSDAYKNGFDGLVTADVKHNCFVDAKNYGISLFDAGHYATENICVKPLCNMLKKKFSDTEFLPFEPDYIKFET